MGGLALSQSGVCTAKSCRGAKQPVVSRVRAIVAADNLMVCVGREDLLKVLRKEEIQVRFFIRLVGLSLNFK